MSDLLPGEVDVVEKYILPRSVVFDVGGFVGEWTHVVLNRVTQPMIHAFEPSPLSYFNFVTSLSEKDKKFVVINNLAVSTRKEISPFWYYKEIPALSGFYERSPFVKKRLGIPEPIQIEVKSITLDEYCQQKGIDHIDFLKIDTEGNELDVLGSAKGLLEKGQVDVIQFEYGGCFVDAGVTLGGVFQLLQPLGYNIFHINGAVLELLTVFKPKMEDYIYSNYLAVLDVEIE